MPILKRSNVLIAIINSHNLNLCDLWAFDERALGLIFRKIKISFLLRPGASRSGARAAREAVRRWRYAAVRCSSAPGFGPLSTLKVIRNGREAVVGGAGQIPAVRRSGAR